MRDVGKGRIDLDKWFGLRCLLLMALSVNEELFMTTVAVCSINQHLIFIYTIFISSQLVSSLLHVVDNLERRGGDLPTAGLMWSSYEPTGFRFMTNTISLHIGYIVDLSY